MRTMAGHAEDHGASVKSLLETQEMLKNIYNSKISKVEAYDQRLTLRTPSENPLHHH